MVSSWRAVVHLTLRLLPVILQIVSEAKTWSSTLFKHNPHQLLAKLGMTSKPKSFPKWSYVCLRQCRFCYQILKTSALLCQSAGGSMGDEITFLLFYARQHFHHFFLSSVLIKKLGSAKSGTVHVSRPKWAHRIKKKKSFILSKPSI